VRLEDPSTAICADISCDGNNHQFPTKIQALVDDLRSVPPNTQR
jgi:hypothetical protein